MEGFLFKWTNFIKGWTICYFVLDKHILYYSKQKGDPNKNAIHLKIAKVSPEKNNKSFIIDTGTNKVHLKANSEEERDIWLNSIANEISILNHSQHNHLKTDPLENVFEKLNQANDDSEEKVKIENNIFKLKLLEETQPVLNNNNVFIKNNNFSIDFANFEENNKLIFQKIEDMNKLIQAFQSTYFTYSIGLENMNFALMKNRNKEEIKKHYLGLVSIKQDFKV